MPEIVREIDEWGYPVIYEGSARNRDSIVEGMNVTYSQASCWRAASLVGIFRVFDENWDKFKCYVVPCLREEAEKFAERKAETIEKIKGEMNGYDCN